MHLVVVRAIHDATLASSLFADLAEESSWLFVVRAESISRHWYASSEETAGGKVKGFLRKSEKLSWERSRSC